MSWPEAFALCLCAFFFVCMFMERWPWDRGD